MSPDGEQPHRGPASSPLPPPATLQLAIDDCRLEIATGALSVGTHRLEGGGYLVEVPHFIPGSTIALEEGGWSFVGLETDLEVKLVGEAAAQAACRKQLASLRAAKVATLPASRDPSLGIPLVGVGAFSLEGTRVAASTGGDEAQSFRRATAAEPAEAFLTVDEHGRVALVDADGLPVSLRSAVFGAKLDRAGAFDLAVSPGLTHARGKARKGLAGLTGKAP